MTHHPQCVRRSPRALSALTFELFVVLWPSFGQYRLELVRLRQNLTRSTISEQSWPNVARFGQTFVRIQTKSERFCFSVEEPSPNIEWIPRIRPRCRMWPGRGDLWNLGRKRALLARSLLGAFGAHFSRRGRFGRTRAGVVKLGQTGPRSLHSTSSQSRKAHVARYPQVARSRGQACRVWCRRCRVM